MPAPLPLSTGFSERPLTLADAGAVTRVMAANELATIGEVHIEEADIVADWQRPSFDVGATTVGVLAPTGELVGYAECSGGARADAAVHPDHWGRGIGTALAAWISARAAELGEPVIGMPVPQGSPGDRLLESLGWFPRWESWVLALPEDAVIPVRDLPDAYAIRAATAQDHEQVWTVIEDAFLEWSEREREPFADWVATVVERPGAEPWNIRVVTGPDGAVVAAAVLVMTEDGREGYVSKLATRKDQRNRGLAQALLADAFGAARAHGATRATLSTDSRTGALDLYRHVGMEVESTWIHRATRP
ncbi:GNAT family N-acetyltransferase [Nocardioides luteus]|uniref:GNAT family N-acetyltransferase n=1 Tax=Nocardioides luteus TaxID=1844 RepID=A0A1J4NBA8_9ACTN|nr:GNAT family N-acetyltransferase [Nocardioides luteus]OIJ28803.1 GNAT family N-acetyltransferase [Nocardioides luteus]